MGEHLIDGEFKSDKYPDCPRGKVPLSCKDVTAQDLLWTYAQRRRAVDAAFSDDLEQALRTAGFVPPPPQPPADAANTAELTRFINSISSDIIRQYGDERQVSPIALGMAAAHTTVVSLLLSHMTLKDILRVVRDTHADITAGLVQLAKKHGL